MLDVLYTLVKKEASLEGSTVWEPVMLKIIIKSNRNVSVFLLVNPYLQEQVTGVDGLTGYSLLYLVGEYSPVTMDSTSSNSIYE